MQAGPTEFECTHCKHKYMVHEGEPAICPVCGKPDESEAEASKPTLAEIAARSGVDSDNIM